MARSVALTLLFLAAFPGLTFAAPEWQPPVEVARGWISTTPVVAGSAGGIAVGWHEARYGDCDDRSQAGCERARVAVRRADGSFFPPVTLNAPNAGHADMLRLAVTAQGDVLAAWHQSDIRFYPDELTSAYYVAVGSVRTGRFRPARRVATYSDSGLDPLTLVTNRRGDAVLGWPQIDADGSGAQRILIRPAGGRWEGPVTVAKPAIMHPPGLALANDGRLLLLWAGRTERRGDMAVRAIVRAPGGDLTPPDVIHTARMEVNSAWANDLTPAWTPEGERLAFWRSGTTSCPYDCGGTVTAYAAWASGKRFAEPQVLSSAPAGLRLVVDSSGRATAAWVEFHEDASDDRDRTEIRFAQRPPGGEFSAPVELAPGAGAPQVEALGRDLFIAWHARSEAGWDFVGEFRPDDPGRRITEKIVSTQNEARLASTPAHELLAAWLQYTDGPDTQVLFASGPDGSIPPAVRALAVSRDTVTRGGHAVRLEFRLSEPAEVELRLRRAGTGRVLVISRVWFEAGRRLLRIPPDRVARLRPGRYVAKLHASDRAGQTGWSDSVRFRVERR